MNVLYSTRQARGRGRRSSSWRLPARLHRPSSFVPLSGSVVRTDDYEDDYTLNRFFATTEIDTDLDGRIAVHDVCAQTCPTPAAGLRRHRAFGEPMGATTTWTPLPCAQYFYGYMPMAASSGSGMEDADEERIGQLVTDGAAQAGRAILVSSRRSARSHPAPRDMTPQLDHLTRTTPTS